MFSLMKLATLAALAFGTFVSAVPVEERTTDIRPFVERQTTDLTSILTTLQSAVQGPSDQLSQCTCSLILGYSSTNV